MKRDILIAVVTAALVAAIAFALAAMRPDRPSTPSSPHESASGEPAKPGKDDKIVMHVNGQPVTEREFGIFLAGAPAEGRAFYGSPAGRRALADEVVKLKVLEQEARKMGLMEDPEVRTQMALAQAQIAAGRALEKLATTKGEQLVRAEYEKEKANAVTLRHILVAYQGGEVPPRQGRTAPSAADAMKKAQGFVAQLRGGADFGAFAQAESDDVQSAQQGGSLGPTRPDMLPPDIASAVTKLKPGEISNAVKTQYGVHIFKVEQPSLEDLRPMLMQRVRQQVAESEVKRLQDAAKVELDPQVFPAVQTPPGAAAPMAPIQPPAQAPAQQ